MYQTSWQLDLNKISQISIIIDSHDTDEGVCKNVLSTIRSLLEKIPINSLDKIYFLGSDSSYTVREINKNPEKIYKKHNGSISIISPAAKVIFQNGKSSKIILIAAGSVFDIEDWVDIIDFYVILPESCSFPTIESVRTYSQNQLEEFNNDLDEKIIKISIEIPDAIPIDWDPIDFSWTRKRVLSYQSNPIEINQVLLTCISLIPIKEPLFAEVNTIRGNINQIQLKNINQIQLKNINQIQLKNAQEQDRKIKTKIDLTPEEATIFDLLSTNEPILCPNCHQIHPIRNLFCEEGSENVIENEWGTPKPIFPTIDEWKGNKEMILFCRSEGKVKANLMEYPCFVLNNGQVIIKEEENFMIYQADPMNKSWIANSIEKGCFIPDIDNQWVVCL